MLDQIIFQAQNHHLDKNFYQRKVLELKKRLMLRLGYHHEHRIIMAINALPAIKINNMNLIQLSQEVENSFNHWLQQ